MAVEEQILLDVKVQDDQALANIAKLSQENDLLAVSLDDLKKQYKSGKISSTEYYKAQAEGKAQIKENTAGIRENSKEIKTNAAQVASAEGSINAMRARIADLTQAYNSLSKEAREGDVGKQITAELKGLNEGVNEANKSVGNFKDNIGNYPEILGGLNIANSSAAKSLSNLGITAEAGFDGLKKGVSSMVKSVGASFKALAANPLVLAFTVLVAAGMAL